MSLLNLLASFLGDPSDGSSPDQTSVTEPNTVQPLTVTAAKKDPPANGGGAPQTAQGAMFNYNNTDSANAVQDALKAAPPQGGSANPGIYGLLPAKLQHGTLRNVLGAIGDAFLVQGGAEAKYGPRMERQEIGQALAGYDPSDPNSVQAAIQRVAATGAPGAAEMADRMQKNYNDAQTAKAAADERSQYHDETIKARKATIFGTMAPKVQGLTYGVTDPAEYARRYQIADGIAKRVDPDADATSAFGLTPPEEWKPGMESGYGMTENQHVVSEDKGKQRQTSERNTDVNAGSRVQAAKIGAGARIQAANISGGKATDAVILEGLINKQNAGKPLTTAEQATFDHLTGKKPHRGLLVPPGGSTSTTAPPAQAVQMLRKNPSLRAAFDAKYGKGASAKYLGR